MFDHCLSTQVVSKRFIILLKCLPLVMNLLKFLENNGKFISISQTILIYDFVITYLFILLCDQSLIIHLFSQVKDYYSDNKQEQGVASIMLLKREKELVS